MIDAINRVYRRALHMIRPAKTTAATVEAGVVQGVQVQLNAFEVRDVKSAQLFGFASALPVGSDVIIANVGGDNANGIIIASNHQGSRPTGLAQGEVRVYDQRGQYMHLGADGTITVVANSAVKIQAPTTFVLGDLMVTGNISDKNGLHGTLDAYRNEYNAHTHGGVQTGGGSTGTNSQPA